MAFLRIVTNPRIFERPTVVMEAWSTVEGWLGLPSVRVSLFTERHHEILGVVLGDAAVRADPVPDAHLAAPAIEHGLVLC